MKYTCTICGNPYPDIKEFKNGHVCEDCLKFFKISLNNEETARRGR